MNISFFDAARVMVAWILSTAMVVTVCGASAAQAHEVFPSIMDVRVDDDTLVFELQANVESFVAGVNLTQTADINQSAQAESYDSLRALAPDQIEARFTDFWPQMAQMMTINVDGAEVLPQLSGIAAGPVGNVELLRTSRVVFTAPLPDGAQTMQFGWASELGALVLRQMDVPAPYDGFVQSGGLTDSFPLAGRGQISGWDTLVGYIPVGFERVLPQGPDHILFLLAMFFLAAGAGPLATQIAVFTVGYAVALASVMLGGISAPAGLIEPMIAATIVAVAADNIWANGFGRWRPYLIFGCALLHGVGLALALDAVGLPETGRIAGLTGFVLGAQIGVLFVIAVAFLCVWQALRVDRGKNEVGQAFAVYGVVSVATLALIALNPDGVQLVLQSPVWVYGVPLVGLFALCAVCVQWRDQIDAFRRFVAGPASIAIAFVGAAWLVESLLA